MTSGIEAPRRYVNTAAETARYRRDAITAMPPMKVANSTHFDTATGAIGRKEMDKPMMAGRIVIGDNAGPSTKQTLPF